MRTDVDVCVYLQSWARFRVRLPALDGLPEVTLPKRGGALLLVTEAVLDRLDRDEQFKDGLRHGKYRYRTLPAPVAS